MAKVAAIQQAKDYVRMRMIDPARLDLARIAVAGCSEEVARTILLNALRIPAREDLGRWSDDGGKS